MISTPTMVDISTSNFDVFETLRIAARDQLEVNLLGQKWLVQGLNYGGRGCLLDKATAHLVLLEPLQPPEPKRQTQIDVTITHVDGTVERRKL